MSYSNKYIFAALPRTTRGTPLVLGSDPKGKNFLYTNGNSVIIRDIENPAIADIYTEHSCQVNVAKYSPSGFYIASGDVSGKVRIWDTINKEHILKNEFQPIGGPIKDIAWSPDNQRMCVVGDGRERFGHVFMSETGTSVGEISKQSKPLNSVDFRPARPFRIATASEDNTVAIFEGPPFKFKCTKSDHTRFVQSVRYSPSGSLLASAGFDGHIYLYDGTSSELKLEVGSPAHKGGVYGVAWSPDGTQLLSCSGDKTCKLWDVETGQVVTEFPMGNSVDDQQVACLWQGSHLLSVSLSGAINYLDVNSPEKPKRILRGHSKPITALTVKPPSLFTASHDGKVAKWNVNTGESVWVGGTGHGNQINGMQISGDELLTCGIDDSLRTATVEAPAEGSDDPQYTDRVLALGSQPRSLAHNPEEKLSVIVTVKELLTIKDGKKLSNVPLDSEAHAVALRLTDSVREVAVGLSNNSLKIWSVGADGTISGAPKYSLTHRGPVTSVRYSPDGKLLAAGDGDRKVILYNADNEYKHFHNKEWGFHAARVNCVGWSADGVRVASGSLDTGLIVWSPANPSKHLIIKNAHPQSQITALEWIDNTTLVSVGQDANTKIWNIDFQ